MGDSADVWVARAAWARADDPAVAEIAEFARRTPALNFARALARARAAALVRARGLARDGKLADEQRGCPFR